MNLDIVTIFLFLFDCSKQKKKKEKKTSFSQKMSSKKQTKKEAPVLLGIPDGEIEVDNDAYITKIGGLPVSIILLFFFLVVPNFFTHRFGSIPTLFLLPKYVNVVYVEIICI